MTLQILPVTVGEGFVNAAGLPLRDLPFLAPKNESLRPLFRFRPPLDGPKFQVSMVWMQLSAMWLLRQILTRDGTTVTLGVSLTSSGVDLIRTVVDPNRPAGQLWYGFEGGLEDSPGRFSWRQTARLYYRPVELAELLGGSDRALL